MQIRVRPYGSWLLDDWSLVPKGLALSMAAVAIIAGVRGAWLARRAKASMNWRPVDGTITRCTLQHTVRERWTMPDLHWYRPRVEYSYSVDGKDYVGKRVYFGAHEWRASSSESSEWILLDYPVGSAVQVFVDPARPAESVLERGRDAVANGYLAIAATAGVIAVISFLAVVA